MNPMFPFIPPRAKTVLLIEREQLHNAELMRQIDREFPDRVLVVGRDCLLTLTSLVSLHSASPADAG